MSDVVSVPADEVIGHRYATRAKGGEKVGHLLTRTWQEERYRRGRPALCGVRAAKWRPVHLFEHAGEFRDCPDCSHAAGLTPKAGRTVRIAPAAPQRAADPIALTPAAAHRLSQAERTARRAGFRESFQQPEGPAYVPLDDERDATYRACRGIAAGWPIPLTPCK